MLNLKYFYPIRFFSDKIIYKLFHLPENFTNQQLKKSYHELIKLYHPDINNGRTIKFLEIQKAYTILSNSNKLNEYNKMSEDDISKFNKLWKSEFNENKEYGKICMDKLNKFLRLNENRKKFVENKIQQIYNKIQVKETLDEKFSQYLYFMLDYSESMFTISRMDFPQIDSYSVIRTKVSDGKVFSVMNIPNDIVNKYTYQNMCITKIISILEKLQDNYSVYFKLYSGKELLTLKDSPIKLINYLQNTKLNVEYRDVMDGTLLYDTLMNSIKTVKEIVSYENITFILLTDGSDTCSKTKIDDLIKYVKSINNLNLIIISVNVSNDTNKILNNIVTAATNGKLINISDEFTIFDKSVINVKNINNAFNEINALIVSKHNAKESNIKEVFNF